MDKPDWAWMTLKEVLSALAISRAELYRRIRVGVIPKPMKMVPLNPGKDGVRSAWRVADIRALAETMWQEGGSVT